VIVIRCKRCDFPLAILKMNIYKFSSSKYLRHDIVYDLLMIRPYISRVQKLSEFLQIGLNYFSRCPKCGTKLNPDKRKVIPIPKRKVKPKGKILLKEW